MDAEPKVIKRIIHAGHKYVSLCKESKVHFHFQTWRLAPKRVLLDDSRKIGKCEPMVLVIGHKFKMEVWEEMLKKMAVGEIASFKVKRELVTNYPFISKTLRDYCTNAPLVKHTCTMTLQNEGLGYSDLDDYMLDACDLEFIIELIKVEHVSEYERDIWQLNIEERLAMIPTLKEKGNKLFLEKDYAAAEDSYSKALGICEQLIIREKKNDEEWINLMKLKVPLLLNYCQCKLLQGEYYTVIEHCTAVLEHDPTNEKAIYRRAKAHVGAWNPSEAEEDFKQLRALNPPMAPTIDKELAKIRKQRKEKSELDKEALQKLFISEKKEEI